MCLARLELVRGQVVRESAPGRRHGMLAVILAAALHQYASSRGLGHVLANTGFVLSRTEHTARVPDYLDAGCPLVWVVDPRCRQVTVHEPGQQATSLRVSDVLAGDPVLPGFRLPLARLFAD